MSLQDLLNNSDFSQQVGHTTQQYPANSIILEENDKGDEVFVVLSGEIHVRTHLENIDHDLSTGLAKLSTGDIFGELSIFDNEPRSAKVIALNDCEIAVINGTKLIAFMDDNPEKGYFLMRDFFMNLMINLRENNHRSKTILQLYLNQQD